MLGSDCHLVRWVGVGKAVELSYILFTEPKIDVKNTSKKYKSLTLTILYYISYLTMTILQYLLSNHYHLTIYHLSTHRYNFK